MYKIVLCFNVFFSESARAIFIKFKSGNYVERILIICSNGFAPLNKMTAMPIYGKTLKNFLLQNQECFEAESWHIEYGDSRSTKFVQMMVVG